jgi:CheY-like chemotaxis protein
METKSEKLQGKHILLVEDEQSLRDTLGHLLRLDHHTVTEANNGAEGLALFAPDRFDVVLTDYMLPFLKGTELSKRIKRLAPNQPIVMITGHSMMPGRHTRVDAVLQKPFSLGELRSALVKVIKVKALPRAPRIDTGTRFYQKLPRLAV